MAKHFEDQPYENAVLYQRIGLIFEPAKNWQTCTMPLTTEEMVTKVMEEMGTFFAGNANLVVKIMEDLCYLYDFNEHNGKRYWLINPVM